MDAKIEEEVVQPHLAMVTLAPGQDLPSGVMISANLIQAELAAYIDNFRDSDFTWEVTETPPSSSWSPSPLLSCFACVPTTSSAAPSTSS